MGNVKENSKTAYFNLIWFFHRMRNEFSDERNNELSGGFRGGGAVVMV